MDRGSGPAPRLLARAAHRDVTPKDRAVRLAGYAARQAPVATILDSIEISALLLEAGGQRCLLLSFDLMLVGSELRNAILARLEKHGLHADEVWLLASHTHSAPATDQACRRLGIPDAQFVYEAAEAAEALVVGMLRQPPSPVRLEIFRGDLDHSINRRLRWPFPTIGRMHGFRSRGITVSPNPSGHRDETATVVVLRQADGAEPLAAIWHYTCHPTAVTASDVISADYPGVAREKLRQNLGDVPCIFAQGFCGNIRPNIKVSGKVVLRERLRRAIRVISSGPLFPDPSFADWQVWSQSLAEALARIANGPPVKSSSHARVQTASRSLPLDQFFAGSTPDKPLAVRLLRIGEVLEIVALSAETTVEWQRLLDQAAPPQQGCIRLYAGYEGALFGYLPTAAQIAEGGYEVDGFQPLFGLAGHFDAARIEDAVTACVKSSFDELKDMERSAPDSAAATDLQDTR